MLLISNSDVYSPVSNGKPTTRLATPYLDFENRNGDGLLLTYRHRASNEVYCRIECWDMRGKWVEVCGSSLRLYSLRFSLMVGSKWSRMYRPEQALTCCVAYFMYLRMGSAYPGLRNNVGSIMALVSCFSLTIALLEYTQHGLGFQLVLFEQSNGLPIYVYN